MILQKSGLTLSQNIMDTGMITTVRLGYSVLNMFVGLMVSRSVTLEARGELNIVLQTIMFFYTFLNFGISITSSFFINKNSEKRHVIYGNMLVFTALSVLLVFISLVVWVLFFPSFIPQVREYWLYILAIIIFYFFCNNLKAVLLVKSQMKKLTVFDFGLKASILICVISLYCVDKMTIEWFLIFMFLEMLISSLFCIFLFKKMDIRFEVSWSYFKSTIAYGIKGFVLLLFIQVLQKSDLYIVKHILGLRYAGIYGVCLQIVDNFAILSTVVSLILFAKLSSTTSAQLKRNIGRKAILWVLGISCVASMILMPFAGFILDVFFKGKGQDGLMTLRLMLLSGILVSIMQIVFTLVMSSGIPKRWMLSFLPVIVFNIGANFKIIPLYKTEGAVIVSMISYLVIILVSIYVVFYSNFLEKKENI
jgi:O-antigen/teichoic acid export membrane protein